jgi:hypothetical protein
MTRNLEIQPGGIVLIFVDCFLKAGWQLGKVAPWFDS